MSSGPFVDQSTSPPSSDVLAPPISNSFGSVQDATRSSSSRSEALGPDEHDIVNGQIVPSSAQRMSSNVRPFSIGKQEVVRGSEALRQAYALALFVSSRLQQTVGERRMRNDEMEVALSP